MDKKVIYVDAAASALKPESVIRAEMDFLQNHYANAGRGVCARATAVDDMVSNTRKMVAEFINASPEQIVFTSGTTDGMNRIPKMIGYFGMHPFDDDTERLTVMASDLDHHSARMPFEYFHHQDSGGFALCPLDENLNLDAANVPRSDIFVITAMSNVLGVPQDVKKLVAAAKAQNPKVITIVDAAQYVAHLPIDVKDWDCDFMCFSGHKIGADTGIGVMYIKDPARWSPDKLGGGMVSSVDVQRHLIDNRDVEFKSHWNFAPGPAKFEAGTLPLTQIAGLGAAIGANFKFHPSSPLRGYAAARISNFKYLDYLRGEFSKISRIRFISPAGAHILTFVIDGPPSPDISGVTSMHPLDFGAMMGAHGVCLRVGNMCASWIHARLGVTGTIRISVGPWNTMEEMEEIVRITKEIIK